MTPVTVPADLLADLAAQLDDAATTAHTGGMPSLGRQLNDVATTLRGHADTDAAAARDAQVLRDYARFLRAIARGEAASGQARVGDAAEAAAGFAEQFAQVLHDRGVTMSDQADGVEADVAAGRLT